MQNIVVVGGGAGGLELATALGNKLGRKKKAKVILVDQNASHLWKPLLHEVAVGTLDDGVDELSYRAHAKNHGFTFQQGKMIGLNRSEKTITLDEIYSKSGELLVEKRQISYDKLVIAIGSKSNDFGTKGVAEYCIQLDSTERAKALHERLKELFLKFSKNDWKEVRIAIVGAGATGIELSAELYHAVESLEDYGVEKLSPNSLNVTLIEAGSRVIPALPKRVSDSTVRELTKLGVHVRTNTVIVEAQADGLLTKTGEKIEADIMVWAAGIRAPKVTQNFDGLAVNRINQIEIKDTLQTTVDDDVFVIGDCAFLMQQNGKAVPPRAQSAHQMAMCCAKNVLAALENKPLKAFRYFDKGTLLSFSRFGTIGSLFGNRQKGEIFIEGKLARLAYLSLYRMHQAALHGWLKTGLILVVNRINRFLRPSMKLH